MKGGLICTWLDFQRGARRRGTWAIRAFSRAIEVAQLSAPVRRASSALWFPQRDWNLKRKSEVRKPEPNSIYSPSASSEQFDLAREGDSRLCPSGGSFTQSLWASLSVSPKVAQILPPVWACWETEFVLREMNSSGSVLLLYLKKNNPKGWGPKILVGWSFSCFKNLNLHDVVSTVLKTGIQMNVK